MTRWSPLEVSEKYAEPWLISKGWRKNPNEKLPFAPAHWGHPNHERVMSLRDAVELQMIKDVAAR